MPALQWWQWLGVAIMAAWILSLGFLRWPALTSRLLVTGRSGSRAREGDSGAGDLHLMVSGLVQMVKVQCEGCWRPCTSWLMLELLGTGWVIGGLGD